MVPENIHAHPMEWREEGGKIPGEKGAGGLQGGGGQDRGDRKRDFQGGRKWEK